MSACNKTKPLFPSKLSSTAKVTCFGFFEYSASLRPHPLLNDQLESKLYLEEHQRALSSSISMINIRTNISDDFNFSGHNPLPPQTEEMFHESPTHDITVLCRRQHYQNTTGCSFFDVSSCWTHFADLDDSLDKDRLAWPLSFRRPHSSIS